MYVLFHVNYFFAYNSALIMKSLNAMLLVVNAVDICFY